MKADKEKTSRMLKTAKGQIDGVLKMIEEDRYCIDISNQLLSIIGIIKNVNREVLHAHLGSCVKNAATGEDLEEKLSEIKEVIDKLSK